MRKFVIAASVGLLALLLVAVQLRVPPAVHAQGSGTTKVAISVSNRSGQNIHLWIGHVSPEAQKAYVTPGGIALWYADMNYTDRSTLGEYRIEDKILVNAMKVGDAKPFPTHFQRTFGISGYARNIRVVYDGDLKLLVDYGSGDSAASGSGGAAAGGVIEWTPEEIEEMTEAANAAIIAIIAGILTGMLGMAGAAPITEPVPGGESAPVPVPAPAPAGPLSSGLLDPDTNEPIPAWEPGKYGPGEDGREGRPGDIWYDGRWQAPSEASAQISATLQRKAEQEAFNQRQLDEWRQRNQDLDREAQARQQAADAAARAEREAQQRAIATMDALRSAALQRGDKDMYERATNLPYGPNGKLDVDLVNRMKKTMVDRIQRDHGAPQEPSRNWVSEGFKNTFDEARHNVLIRIGAGILTGGTSEIGYLGQAAHDAMTQAAAKALRENRGFGYGDALRAGTSAAAKERLPVNTINLITTKGRSATLTELGGALLGDAMAGKGLHEGMRNLGASASAYRGGKGTYDILTARPGSGGGLGRGAEPPGGPVTPQSLRGLPEGTPLPPGSAGISKAAARQQQWVSDVRGVEIKTRPVSNDVLRRLAQGDIPKPATIKAKTINSEDVLLGAPAGQNGRVGFFEPKMPSTTGMSPEQIIDLQKRFIQRRNEFKNLAQDMRSLQAQGKITIEGGVVKAPNGKYITGDHDIYSITMKDGSPCPPWLKEKVLEDLKKPPFSAQHGAHKDWKFDPNDPLHGKSNVAIDQKIRGDHAPPAPVDQNVSIIEQRMAPQGGTPLVTTAPNSAAPRTTFDHGEVMAS